MRIRSPIAGDSDEKDKKQHRRTYKDMTPAEEARIRKEKRLEREYQDRLDKEEWLRTHNPTAYEKLILTQAGYVERREDDPLKETLKTLEAFKRAGLLGEGKGKGGGNAVLDSLTDIVDSLANGEGTKELFKGLAGGAQQPRVIEHQPVIQQAQPQPQPQPQQQAPQEAAPMADPKVAQAIHEQIQQIITAIEPPGKPRVEPAEAAKYMQGLAMVPERFFPGARLVKSLINDARNMEPTKKAVKEYLETQLEANPNHRELWEWFGSDIARLEWLFALVQHLHGQTTAAPAEGI